MSRQLDSQPSWEQFLVCIFGQNLGEGLDVEHAVAAEPPASSERRKRLLNVRCEVYRTAFRTPIAFGTSNFLFESAVCDYEVFREWSDLYK